MEALSYIRGGFYVHTCGQQRKKVYKFVYVAGCLYLCATLIYYLMFRFVFFSFLSLLVSSSVQAATESEKRPVGVVRFIRKVGSIIDSMSVRGLDRQYIEAPKQPWQVIARGNINQSDLHLKSRIDGGAIFTNIIGELAWEPRIKTEPATYAGVWAGYRGYGFGYSWNVGGDKGRILTFGATGGSYGINLRIHSFSNNKPEVHYEGLFQDGGGALYYEDDRETYELLSPVRTRTLLLDAYYFFNGKRFSYAAAYDQSVIQRRSAGSLMAGGMYYHSHTHYADDCNADLILLMDDIGRFKQWQLSLGAGYAYNLVPCRGLLISAMAMPMLTVFDRHKTWRYDSNLRDLAMDEADHSEDEVDELVYQLKPQPLSITTRHSWINVNFDIRLSLTYQFKRFFINAYGQYSNFRYKDGGVRGVMNDWYVNAAVGVRL